MGYRIIEYGDTHMIEINSIIFDLYNMGYVVDVTSAIQKVDIDNTNKTYHLSVFKDHIHLIVSIKLVDIILHQKNYWEYMILILK